jgi:ribosomal protein S18 acetylase RimI-like enzyme
MFADNAKIVLWVLKGNDKAIHFYKKFGFDFNGNQKTLPFGVELQMELRREKASL